MRSFNGEKSSKNPMYLEAVTHSNIKQSIYDIRNNSPIIKEMEEQGKIKIVGGEYHMLTGKVDFISK